ncbi:hypothetical protein PSI23_07965 [Xenorhabdus sp. XENO-10]|uniref:Integrase n=1 Tax=Xenorhabdus yunnanensis TaxID=3025878 RepID=A0ABT5LHI7_9GAMM|nr:hypothetical protein [Xenorhabdus yunnanensis]MDC9589260.1 hypothetical protein [Xenorhabdus yunnanensis]
MFLLTSMENKWLVSRMMRGKAGNEKYAPPVKEQRVHGWGVLTGIRGWQKQSPRHVKISLKIK